MYPLYKIDSYVNPSNNKIGMKVWSMGMRKNGTYNKDGTKELLHRNYNLPSIVKISCQGVMGYKSWHLNNKETNFLFI